MGLSSALANGFAPQLGKNIVAQPLWGGNPRASSSSARGGQIAADAVSICAGLSLGAFAFREGAQLRNLVESPLIHGPGMLKAATAAAVGASVLGGTSLAASGIVNLVAGGGPVTRGEHGNTPSKTPPKQTPPKQTPPKQTPPKQTPPKQTPPKQTPPILCAPPSRDTGKAPTQLQPLPSAPQQLPPPPPRSLPPTQQLPPNPPTYQPSGPVEQAPQQIPCPPAPPKCGPPEPVPTNPTQQSPTPDKPTPDKPTPDKPTPDKPTTPAKPTQTPTKDATPTQTYVVQKGDYLTHIAQCTHRTWQQIYAANRDQIQNPDLIYAGEKLTIPAANAPSPDVQYQHLFAGGHVNPNLVCESTGCSDS